jgi:hypothetical protein
MKRMFVLLFLSFAALAQEKPVTISGIVFGDFYQFLSSHDAALEGRNGFLLRRGYLGFDKTFSDALSARLRFEVNQPGDYRTNLSMEPFVKDAFLRWKYDPKHELIVGIQPPATWETAERLWGYRTVERVAVEVFRLGSSRDFGIAAAGGFGRVRYHVMVGNGSGTGNEVNVGKKVAAAVSYAPTALTIVEVYADRTDADRSNYQAFAAYTAATWRTGVHLAHQKRGDLDLDVASVYGVMDVRKDVTLLARVDRMFDPNPEGNLIAYLSMSTRSPATLFIAGVDYRAHKNVSVIPNVELVTYDDDTDATILARVTLAFTF